MVKVSAKQELVNSDVEAGAVDLGRDRIAGIEIAVKITVNGLIDNHGDVPRLDATVFEPVDELGLVLPPEEKWKHHVHVGLALECLGELQVLLKRGQGLEEVGGVVLACMDNGPVLVKVREAESRLHLCCAITMSQAREVEAARSDLVESAAPEASAVVDVDIDGVAPMVH